MFRTTIFRTSRAIRSAIVRPVLRTVAVRPTFVAPTKAAFTTGVRYYSAPASLSQVEVQGRIMDLLKGFDKVTDETKVTEESHFTKDLGLDSLDTVEVVMAIEEEFSIEIPDADADQIHSIKDAVTYILSQPDAH